MKRAVLDTNALVSAIVQSEGTCGKIYDRWRQGEFELVISGYFLDELYRILTKKIGLSHVFVQERLGQFKTLVDYVDPAEIFMSEINDLPILGTATAGHADVIVTGDKVILKIKKFDEIRVINPREFLEILKNNSTSSQAAR